MGITNENLQIINFPFRKKLLFFFPLLLSNGYLLFTIWLLLFGPIIWPLENRGQLLTLLGTYIFFLNLGYIWTVQYITRARRYAKPQKDLSSKIKTWLIDYFWLVLTLAFIANIITHRNVTHSNSYFPSSFFQNFWIGLTEPWLARKYYASESYKEAFTGNVYVTSSLIFLSFFKYILLPLMILIWPELSRKQKLLTITITLMPIATAISISISATLFSYSFIISTILILIVLAKKGWRNEIKQRKAILLYLALITFFSGWFFYAVKAGTFPNQVFVNKSTPSRFDYLKEKNIIFKSDMTGQHSFISDLSEKLTVYLVQGYQGMSFSLSESFESTFGFGHSIFLMRNIEKYFNINLTERSFQRKITKKWDENIYWHSAFSYFANDVSFQGVSLVMLLLGSLLALTYISAIHSNIAAQLLMPILVTLILYLPANNHIFSSLENLASFWPLCALVILSNRFKRI